MIDDNFDNLNRPEFGSATTEIKVSYQRDGVAPLEMWDELPEIAINDRGYERFINLVNTVAESEQIMSALPEGLAKIISELRGVDIAGGQQISRSLDLEGQRIEVPIDPRGLIDAKFCHGLLFKLSELGFSGKEGSDPAVEELVGQIYQEMSDDLLFQISDLSINGRLLPKPEGTYLVGGAKKWDQVARMYTETGEQRTILFVPDPESPKIMERISRASELISGPHPVDFLSPQESYEDLSWGILNDDGRDPAVLFARIERYGTLMHEHFSKIASFIRWAQEDAATSSLAEKLKQEYVRFTEVEVGNLSESHFSHKGPLDLLVGQSLPDFEIPHRLGRATGHLNLEEHIETVRRAENRPRTKEELQEGIRNLLLKPLKDVLAGSNPQG